MTIADLQVDINKSLKAGDGIRVDTLRFLLSAVRNAGIAKYGAEMDTKLSETDIQDVVKKQVKSHKESVEAFTNAHRDDLVSKEQAQLDILEKMLPAEISDSELKAILTEVAKSGEPNFGKLMGLAMSKVAGKASGGRVSAMLKTLVQTT
jgi:uncharacterized protein